MNSADWRSSDFKLGYPHFTVTIGQGNWRAYTVSKAIGSSNYCNFIAVCLRFEKNANKLASGYIIQIFRHGCDCWVAHLLNSRGWNHRNYSISISMVVACVAYPIFSGPESEMLIVVDKKFTLRKFYSNIIFKHWIHTKTFSPQKCH